MHADGKAENKTRERTALTQIHPLIVYEHSSVCAMYREYFIWLIFRMVCHGWSIDVCLVLHGIEIEIGIHIYGKRTVEKPNRKCSK